MTKHLIFSILLAISSTGLFSQNHKSLFTQKPAIWEIVTADKTKSPNPIFDIQNGILKVANGMVGYIRTKKAYSNYTLELQWRWTKKAGNSGVLIHIQPKDTIWPVCFQVQQKANAAGDIICMNGLNANECTDKVKFTIPKITDSNEKQIGEWNSMKVICKNGTLEVFINGTLQNKATGLTAKKGFIGFQAEGTEMEFRNLYIYKP